MADISSTCTMEIAAMFGKKIAIVTTSAAAATGDTIEMANVNLGEFSAIDIVYAADDDGGVVIVAIVAGATEITLGTITTGIHKLLVIGDN